MDCRTIREQLGAYLDGELDAGMSARVVAHLSACSGCALECERVRALIGRLGEPGEASENAAPPELWAAIEARLTAGGDAASGGGSMAGSSAAGSPLPLRPPHGMVLDRSRRLLALAASVALLVGAGVLVGVWLYTGPEHAQATAVDYSLLLDGLASDVDGAVKRFLEHYGAVPMQPAEVLAAAPGMRFAIPATLPGGFQLEQAYRLRLGSSVGTAARYRRGTEPLFVFFHPPVDKTQLGLHKESHCQVAGREGHRVEVGPWRLLHFTDETTCHCLLSRLDLEADQLAVMAAVAPDFSLPPPAGK